MLLQGLLIVFTAVVLFWIIKSIVKVFVALVQACVVGLITAFGFTLLVLPAESEGLLAALVVGIVAFALTFRSALKSSERRRSKENRTRVSNARQKNVALPKARPAMKAEPIETKLGVKEPQTLIAAWQAAAELCPQAELEKPRESCARLLKLVQSGQNDDFELIETASFVRRQVPDLVKEAGTFCALCNPQEREETILNLRAQLGAIGAMAADQVDKYAARISETLALRRTHIAQRLLYFKRCEWSELE